MAAVELVDFQDIQTAVLEEIGEQVTNTNALNKVKRYVNMIYIDEVVAYHRWRWLEKTIDIIHKQAHNDGTASVTPNSPTVTLSTAPSVALGSFLDYRFSDVGFDEIYTVSAHTAGSVTVTLSTDFQGQLNATSSYVIWRDRLDLPTDAKETFDIDHDKHGVQMKGVGRQEFDKIRKEAPKSQGFPAMYHTTDFKDPTSGTPETESDRFRQVLLYPAIELTKNVTIHVNYIQDVTSLDLDADEPVMDIHDRIVLFYGAVSWAWRNIARNPEEADRRWLDFDQKRARMAGKLEDGFDSPSIGVKSRYLAKHRRGRIGSRRTSDFFNFPAGGGSSNSNITFLSDVTIASATVTGEMTFTSSGKACFTGLGAASVPFLDSGECIISDNTNFTYTDSTDTLNVVNLIASALVTITTGIDLSGTTITLNKGNDEANADDSAGLIVEMSDATDVKLLFDKDATSRWRIGDSGSEIEITTISDTQSLTNKTIGDTNTINAQDDAFTIDDASDATLQIDFNAAGTTSTKTTITSSQTANRVVTLPDAADTLVGKATTDSLTNKTISGTTNTINANDATFTVDDNSDATKQLDFSLGGATTSTKTTIASSQTAARTITLPDATDTLTGKATTDTLTNKTISGTTNTINANDATFTIDDNSDATKQLDFSLGGATTSTKTTIASSQTAARTLTLPDVTDTLAGIAATQTLTNKTLSNPEVNTEIILLNQASIKLREQTGNGTNFIGLSAPDAVTGDVTFKLPNGDGAANQFLKTDGSANLDWAGPMAALTISAKSADFTVLDTDGIEIIDVTTSTTDRTITLPTASANTGRVILIRKVDSASGNVIVDGEGAETIDGLANFYLSAQHHFVVVISNGTEWFINSLDVTQALGSTSSLKTPTADGNYSLMTGGSLSLIPGTWRLNPSLCNFANNGTPAYSRQILGWFGANGADSSTQPALVSSLSGVTILSGWDNVGGMTDYDFADDSTTLLSNGFTITNTSTVTVFLVPFANMTTASTARIRVIPEATRLK